MGIRDPTSALQTFRSRRDSAIPLRRLRRAGRPPSNPSEPYKVSSRPAASRHAVNNSREDVWVCFVELDVYLIIDCLILRDRHLPSAASLIDIQGELDLDSSLFISLATVKNARPLEDPWHLWKLNSINVWDIAWRMTFLLIAFFRTFAVFSRSKYFILKWICVYIYRNCPIAKKLYKIEKFIQYRKKIRSIILCMIEKIYINRSILVFKKDRKYLKFCYIHNHKVYLDYQQW